MKLYNDSFYNTVNNYIDIVEDENDKISYLSTDEYVKQLNIVENFIKKYQLKIYGGVAINISLPKNAKIYKELKGKNKIVDYDVYTPHPKKYAVDLGNELYQAGFQYVDIVEGVNAGVYKVFNFFQEVVDFVFIPEKIYTHIPFIIENGMRYVAPNYLRIDLLVSLTNPTHAIFRWDKDKERLDLLNKYNPIERPKKFCMNGANILDKNILNILNEVNYIIFGNIAYLKYMEKSQLEDYYIPQTRYIEIGTNDIKTLLNNINQSKYTIAKYNPFLKYIPSRYIISKNDNTKQIVLIIYDLNEKCVPYVELDGIKYITYDALVLHYNFMIYLAKRYNIYQTVDESNCCIYELDRGRRYYFSRTNENEFTMNPFRSFVIDCIGKQKNVYRDSKIRGWNREKRFRYIPSKRKYMTSGSKVGSGTVFNISGEYQKSIFQS